MVKSTWVMFFGVTQPSASPVTGTETKWTVHISRSNLSSRRHAGSWCSVQTETSTEQPWLPGGTSWWGPPPHLPLEEHLLLFRGRQRDLQGEGEIELLPGTCRRHENLQGTKPEWPCFQLDTTAFNGFRCSIWTTLGMQHKWFRCKRDPQLLAFDL